MTMLADRRRMSAELDAELRGLLGRIGATAAVALATEPRRAQAALASVEIDGRDALRRMREIVDRPADVDADSSPGPVGPLQPLRADGRSRRPPPAPRPSLPRPRWERARAVVGEHCGDVAARRWRCSSRVRSVRTTSRGNVGVVLLCVGLQAASGGGFNPLFEMIALGPWLAGRAVRSRRRLAARIETRNRELEEARALHALAAVRYERARIAHELHDIVAHCVTLVVVQATAAQRLANAQPERVAHALTAITEARRGRERDRAARPAPGRGRPSRRVDDRGTRARSAAAGVEVRYRCPASFATCDRRPPTRPTASFRRA